MVPQICTWSQKCRFGATNCCSEMCKQQEVQSSSRCL